MADVNKDSYLFIISFHNLYNLQSNMKTSASPISCMDTSSLPITKGDTTNESTATATAQTLLNNGWSFLGQNTLRKKLLKRDDCKGRNIRGTRYVGNAHYANHLKSDF